ncbi:MAG: adenine deaminase [Lentimicrobium sp.]|jgi:adenine deaminase|nr:adenine deaminase [Lentimicrobium sp.]MDD2527331.1 adenine deaminase [Lentimicrobiaceae bacterium]MDD4597184.1 adenine deaminase [Lentimicrobiaceae bacterium]MDY0025382.1 adenine deaminase [Lentimicrobium sp.]
MNKIIEGNLVDVVGGQIFPGRIIYHEGIIVSVEPLSENKGPYILPGLIDAHVHIESSMLLPSEFARLAVVHGTTATVSDPHEIANVLGIEGVKFMIENGKTVPFHFNFGAPSCVPATQFESSGANLGAEQVDELLAMPEIKYLSEMMNYPGVLSEQPEVMEKLNAAKKYNKPVDGHAPGILGDQARQYAAAGISTDHECFTQDEAIDKIQAGMKVLIREGSAARNFDELIPLLKYYPDMIMFCSDDKHPDDLIKGHINLLIKRALDAGLDFMDVIRACTLNPVMHYGLNSGLLQEGDYADFIVVDNLKELNIIETYVEGRLVASNGKSLIKSGESKTPNNFNARHITTTDLKIKAEGEKIRIQRAIEGQLITEAEEAKANIVDGFVESDVNNDVLKMLVMNRYRPSNPALSFVSGFGLKHGAIASTVAHDSHNIIAVGADDESLVMAVNALVESKGGICVVNNDDVSILPLPVAGIMSDGDGYMVAEQYQQLNKKALELGTSFRAPFMTLSFMALLVIPAIKLSDRGLFDGNNFSLVGLFK